MFSDDAEYDDFLDEVVASDPTVGAATRDNEAWCAEWNAENKVGDECSWTEDHGMTWDPSTLASKAFVKNGKPVVRVVGAKAPVHLKDVVPEPHAS